MCIQTWANWIELQRDVDFNESLDIRQIPDLVKVFADKFFQNGKELNLYRGLYRIVEDYLPAPQLGMSTQSTRQPKL